VLDESACQEEKRSDGVGKGRKYSRNRGLDYVEYCSPGETVTQLRTGRVADSKERVELERRGPRKGGGDATKGRWKMQVLRRGPWHVVFLCA